MLLFFSVFMAVSRFGETADIIKQNQTSITIMLLFFSVFMAVSRFGETADIIKQNQTSMLVKLLTSSNRTKPAC
ncbi:hypothetical protein MHYP_G00361040 [Metynnis hypsauchen]